MAKPEIELSPELSAWIADRKIEIDLEKSIAHQAANLREKQKANRDEAMRQFKKGEATKLNSSFETIQAFLRTDPEDRSPELTKDYYLNLDTIGEEYGKYHITTMVREWRLTPQVSDIK